MSPLILSKAFYEKIEHEGAAAFPNECCGIIYGRDEPGRRIVTRLEPVPNDFETGERYHRFMITPGILMQAEKTAVSNSELLLGFYHSHPNHPARPSEYDREHGWPFYSYVIVSIMNCKPADMTCWLLNEQTEQFEQQEICHE